MTRPRTKNGHGVHFPYAFEKNGRTGRIKKWSDGKFGTYFMYAGEKCRNSFSSFEAAYEFLERIFTQLDSGLTMLELRASASQDLRTYNELKQLVKEQANGSTVREAVDFFLVHREHKKFSPKTVAECIESFLAEERARNLSTSQITTLVRHLGHFSKDFGSRRIHTVSAQEISQWLANFHSEDGKLWSAKTRRNVRGSLVSMSLHARKFVNAIPDLGETEFQKVKNPKDDEKGEVEIYSPDQMQKLLLKALEWDVRLLPPLVIGGFSGLRPDEIHGENVERESLVWKAFNWNDRLLHVGGQKVRSNPTRDVPLNRAVETWGGPFKALGGAVWTFSESYARKMRELHEKAEVPRFFDGLRHSFASYRIRVLGGNLEKLAYEMGNSAREIVSHYKRNVTDEHAEEWFAIAPPADYDKRTKAALALYAKPRDLTS